MATKVSRFSEFQKSPHDLRKRSLTPTDAKKKQPNLHKLLKKMCFLFHKISYKLEGDCPIDVGDQALAVFILTSKDVNKPMPIPKAELQNLVKLVDDLLPLEGVNDLDESKELKKINSELQNCPGESNSLSGSSMSWAENVLHLLGLEYQHLENYRYILDCPAGDLYGLQRQICQIWECRYHEIVSHTHNDINSLKSDLSILGYSTSVVKKIASSIPDPFIKCQNSLYWSIRYLAYKMFNNPMLAYVPRYPFKEEILNKLFEQDLEDCDCNSEEVWPVKMINVSDDVGDTKVERYLESQGSGLYFHGTSHYDAMLILRRGVDLSVGSSGQDFSSGDGFYLSDSLKNARRWAGAGRGKKYQAVIVYKLNLADHDGLDLNGGSDEWQNIVALCRGQYENNLQKMELVKNVSYIRGPACINAISAIQNNTTFESEQNIQLCIRDKAFANSECNVKNICCVVFY
ncbi:unnamed protein product [Lymnaea stagnalis]|uniref:PARP catalytic domain-containing protein n=1 Tax=Lymnaea stagnalis TaxID=6523 RepID=A0AAV2I7K0_LYMST